MKVTVSFKSYSPSVLSFIHQSKAASGLSTSTPSSKDTAQYLLVGKIKL